MDKKENKKKYILHFVDRKGFSRKVRTSLTPPDYYSFYEYDRALYDSAPLSVSKKYRFVRVAQTGARTYRYEESDN